MMNAEFSIGLLQATLATSVAVMLVLMLRKVLRFNAARTTQGKKVEGWVPVPVEFAPHEPTESPKAG